MHILQYAPQFSRPLPVTDEEFASGTKDPDRLMPTLASLDGVRPLLDPWVELAKHVRQNGFDPMAKVRLRTGVEHQLAARHLGACLASRLPVSERDLRVAALMAAWFEAIRIPGGPRISQEITA